MKKFGIIFFVTIIINFMSCSKDDPITIDPNTDETTDDGGDNTSSAVLWEYKIEDFDTYLSDLAIDDNDNSYFVVSAGEYYLISVDKDGTERWKMEISGDISYSNTYIMVINDNIIVTTGEKIYSFSSSLGILNWEADISTYCLSATYSNNTIYTAGTNALTNEAVISAYTTNGNLKWEYTLTKHRDINLSSYQDYLCFSSEDYTDSPYKKGFMIIKDEDSSASKLWEAYSDIATTPNTKASFDVNGNVYYEETLNDITYISSYKIESGIKNWTTELSSHPVYNPIILTENNIIVASYIDNDYDGGINSITFIDPTNGNIISNFNDKLSEPSEIFFNENSSVITFDYIEDQGPSFHIISQDEVANTFDGSIVGSIMSFKDCKINSTGNTLFLDDAYLICGEAKPEYRLPPVIGVWNGKNGNNYNTNSLLQ